MAKCNKSNYYDDSFHDLLDAREMNEMVDDYDWSGLPELKFDDEVEEKTTRRTKTTKQKIDQAQRQREYLQRHQEGLIYLKVLVREYDLIEKLIDDGLITVAESIDRKRVAAVLGEMVACYVYGEG